MRLAGNLRPLLLAFALAATACGICFGYVQHLRSAQGPCAVSLDRGADPLFQFDTVLLKNLGHQIQLLPRTLGVDSIDRVWRSDETSILKHSSNIATPSP